MYHENPSVTDVVKELTATSCTELFADYGVVLQRGDYDWSHSDQTVVSSVMGFVGDNIRGTCLLAAEPKPLEASCPSGGRPRDWIGELTNQLVGRIKMKLLTYRLEVALTTPIVLQGIRLQPLPRNPSEPNIFSSDSGLVLAWVEVEIEDTYSLPVPGPAAVGETGGLLFF
jgi:hypothetical protein